MIPARVVAPCALLSGPLRRCRPPGLEDYRRGGRFDTFKSSQSSNPFSADGIYYIQILLQPRGETTFTGGAAEASGIQPARRGPTVWVETHTPIRPLSPHGNTAINTLG